MLLKISIHSIYNSQFSLVPGYTWHVMGYWPSPAKVPSPQTFLFFFLCDDLSFINTTEKTLKTYQKNVSVPRMDEKKCHTQEFQLKGIGGNMRCRLLQKGLLEKQQSVSNTFNILSLTKVFFQNLRCIFQISVKVY